MRRDTCVTLGFDMRSFLTGSDTFDGLKIPSTPSVRNNGSEMGKKLLHLRIRVLGATTKTPYDTLCHECKDREGRRDAFPDFRARSNILVPQRMEGTPEYPSLSLWRAVPSTTSRVTQSIGEWVPRSMDGRLTDDSQSRSYPE